MFEVLGIFLVDSISIFLSTSNVLYSVTASVARFPEVSRLSALPRDVTDEEMDQIINVAKRHINDITSNVRKTWDDMLGPWTNSAPFSYSASTRSLSSGVVQGLKGLQSVETSRRIANL